MLRFFPAKHQKILKLSIPAAINSLLDMLQVITDLIMVGRISLLPWQQWGLVCSRLCLFLRYLRYCMWGHLPCCPVLWVPKE